MSAPVRAGATLVAVGLGGRLELSRNEIRIVKDGFWGYLVEALWLGYGIMEKRIFLEQIAGVEIVKMLVMPNFIRFSYPGSPTLTGHYAEDALAENALLMNPLDNRKFYELKDRIHLYIERKA
jgi:hypothetical protein